MQDKTFESLGDSKQKQALIDLTGTDAPERFEISAKYPKNKSFIEFIKRLAQGKRENKINSLSICGIDESGFQSVYNVDSFQQKIKISCQKDANGKFAIDSVLDGLLKKIG